MEIRLERRPVGDLKPYEQNVKVHLDADVDAIVRSIARFGFNDPIGILPDGTIVEGEGRWFAANRLGLEEVPVLVLSAMSEREADLYRIAHNKIALTTGFNMEALVAVLRSLVGEDIALTTLGFDDEAMSRLLLGLPQGVTAVGSTVAAGQPPGATHEYVIIWDDAEQKKAFDKFLSAIHERGEPAPDALLRRLSEALYGPEQDTQAEEDSHERVNA